jgi:hypothetical protein
MADIEYSIIIRFDGKDADAHELDLFALGESLQGVARIAAVAGHFALTQRYSRYFASHEVKVMAREPRENCFSLQVIWNFVRQYDVLQGSFGAIVGVLLPLIFTHAAGKYKEMKLLKDALDKAIHELGSRDDTVVSRLLDTVEKMASDLRPAARQAVTPIGTSCRTMTIQSQTREDCYDEADKAAITKDADDELTELRKHAILITELDLERGTCKVHLESEAEDKRIAAVITDPLLQTLNNPYSLAFAAGERIQVKAKALIRGGDIGKLFISDIG